jgi:ornithine racemase
MPWHSLPAKESLLPRIEISLSQIRDNVRLLSALYGRQGISLMGVSKAVLGEPAIIEAMMQGGVQFIADSRLANIQRMKAAGLAAQFVLMRTALSQAADIIASVDISLNTEITTLTELDYYAQAQHKIHQVIVMVELGDLREGVLPIDLAAFIRATLALSHLKIVGIGCNLACYGGIKPDRYNLGKLSELADDLEKEFLIKLKIVSGGNSANYEWYESGSAMGRINNLRLGESIFLGREALHRRVIPGLHTGAFRLVAEVIEAKLKPSVPWGESGQDAFGDVHNFPDHGIRQRSILALGRQDVLVSGLRPPDQLTILGASSDHIILDSHNYNLRVGDTVDFDLDYGSLLAAMTSPFIAKQFV